MNSVAAPPSAIFEGGHRLHYQSIGEYLHPLVCRNAMPRRFLTRRSSDRGDRLSRAGAFSAGSVCIFRAIPKTGGMFNNDDEVINDS